MLKEKNYIFKGGKNIIIFDVEHSVANVTKPDEKKEDEQISKIGEAGEWIDSTISSILLQQIINYCVPIIKEMPKVNVNMKDYQKKVEAKEASVSGINIIPNHDINCILEKDGSKIKITKNQLITVVGIKINSDIRSNNWIHSYDYLAPGSNLNKWHLSQTRLNEILITGLFGAFNFHKDYYYFPYLAYPIKLYSDAELFNISLLGNTETNNKAIYNFYKTYSAIGQEYNSTYLTFGKSLLEAKKIKINNSSRHSGFISDDNKLIKWLVASKLIVKNDLRNLHFSVEIRTLINKIKWYGVENSASKPYIEKLKFFVFGANQANEELIKSKKIELEINFKKSIAYKKYNIDNLNILSASQLKLIDQEYKKSTEKKSQIISDKTISINNYILELMNSKDGKNIYLQKHLEYILSIIPKDDRAKLEKQLSNVNMDQSSDVNKNLSIIQIGSDDSICPHLVEMGILLVRGMSANNTGIQILAKYSSQESESKTSVHDMDDYCKVCGALLAEYDEEEISYKEKDSYMMDIEDDEIFSMVKKELQYVIDYYIDVVITRTSSTSSAFGPDKSMVVALRNIIDMLANIIRNKIIDIQSDLVKIKTMNENDMWVMINIYIYIYIFALLSQFIFTNSDMLQFKHFAGKIDTNSKNRTTETNLKGGRTTESNLKGGRTTESNLKGGRTAVDSKGILESLLKNKQGKANLEKIINFALELVKKIKYADINGSKYINMINIKDLFLTAYKWTMSLNYDTLTVDGESTGATKKESDLDNNNILNYFKMYGKIGRSNDQIEKDFGKSVAVYSTVEVATSASKSVQMMYEYIVKERYLENPVPPNPEIEKTYADFFEIKFMENNENKKCNYISLRPYAELPNYEIDRDYTYIKQLPFKLVGNCPKGCDKKYVYKFGKTINEFTKKEITSWLENKEQSKLDALYKAESLGSRCICANKKNTDVVTFYKYFEQYCPKGELHDYGDQDGKSKSEKCKKCAITNQIILELDSVYYSKWKDMYLKTRMEERILIDKNMNDRLNTFTNITKNTNGQIHVPEIKMSNIAATELSKLFGIKNLYNLFCTIGMYEGNDYKKIEGNQIQLFLNASDEEYQLQATVVHNYVLYMYRNYYAMKNSEYQVKIPYDLKNLLTKTSQSNRDFSKKLPNIESQYIQYYNFYSGSEIKSELLANFVISELARLFLQIFNNFKKAKLEKFGGVWCQFYLAKIIGFEKHTCLIKLKSLKPLTKYQNDDLAEDTKMEDGDMINNNADGNGEYVDTNESVIDEYDEVGNIFALDDMDIELGEDGEENLYDNKILEG